MAHVGLVALRGHNTEGYPHLELFLPVQLIHVEATSRRHRVRLGDALARQWPRGQIVEDHLGVVVHRFDVLNCLYL